MVLSRVHVPARQKEITMPFHVDINISAPFAIGDLVARLHLEAGNSRDVVLRQGRFMGTVPLRPHRITLTTSHPPPDEAPLTMSDMNKSGEANGEPVNVHSLFGKGYHIGDDGRVALQLVWGMPCHNESLPKEPSRKRFASWEHVICGHYVGMSSTSDNANPLTVNHALAPFGYDTPLPIGDKRLTFGEIICLAGDFYAHLDDQAVHDFASAWPPLGGFTNWIADEPYTVTLENDSAQNVTELLSIIQNDKDKDQGSASEFTSYAFGTGRNNHTARRYIALATANHCHFASPKPGWSEKTNEALQLYRAYHGRAIREAQAASSSSQGIKSLHQALATDAFGCHFLSDLFASGHMRVPRRLLGEQHGAVSGGDMSHRMHDEDNHLGLWCMTRQSRQQRSRVVWQTYGDGMLRRDVAALHLKQVQEAVRRSAAEVFASFCGTRLPVMERAEAILPIPLPPGSPFFDSDVFPHGQAIPQGTKPNHWPLYWFRSDHTVLERIGRPYQNLYRAIGGSFTGLTLTNPFSDPIELSGEEVA